jgi:hypothetical protein
MFRECVGPVGRVSSLAVYKLCDNIVTNLRRDFVINVLYPPCIALIWFLFAHRIRYISVLHVL